MCERESCIMSSVPLERTANSLREMASNDGFCDELKTPKAACVILGYYAFIVYFSTSYGCFIVISHNC